jgi:dinuclear metal center YbgI/SA1388 family protein
MLIGELDAVFRGILDFETTQGIDTSINGLQVETKDGEIRRVAFAVDASMESFKRAVSLQADLLFVHHGILWADVQPLTGGNYRRIRYLIENDLALYAAHLPLDCHPEIGNNAVMARRLGLAELQPFGAYRGLKIGFKGVSPQSLSLDEICARLFGKKESCLAVLPFGPRDVKTVGIVSGGAPESAYQAIDEGLDLLVTGDASHQLYHPCLEAGINVVFGGHYQTERWGVQALSERLEGVADLETCLIEIPTGL